MLIMTTEREITVGEIRGRKVLDSAGNDLGSVDDVTFDTGDMEIKAFIVKVSREAADRLHLDRPTLGTARLQVSADRLQTIGDNILLNVEQADMAAMLYGGPPTSP
jgi:sporulation protein YlmC with PRC-barrel domain